MNEKVVVCELDRVAVGAVSQTLAQLGVNVAARIRRISLQSVGHDDVFVSSNRPATANDFLLIPLATSIRINSLSAAALQFISPGGNGELNVQQDGDE